LKIFAVFPNFLLFISRFLAEPRNDVLRNTDWETPLYIIKLLLLSGLVTQLP
jgi:di/tricarboxylate transporter